jgi:site-specific DNA recombinase
MKLAAIYARVSSDQQREEKTIASQTSALIEFAKENEFEVPKDWIFEDDGYSGATLERPGLERVRDLAAEGQIQAVLVYSPDRLSRKYAHQVVLVEELARHGVETRFVRAPKADTPEEQLLVQFTGAFAEYERAQFTERSRRGKRYKAKSGQVSVLGAAPYGYLYIKKTDEAPAAYRVIEAEALVVNRIYKMYTTDGLSISAIAKGLTADGVPTRKSKPTWAPTVVWNILRNPAYRGVAAFGKTRTAERKRVTRTQRLRGGFVSRQIGGRERSREEWIEIPVPRLVSDEVFAQAQERLEENKVKSQRRTITPSVLQGLVSCLKCGYAYGRSSTQKTSTGRKYSYYRCLGSEPWRRPSATPCDNKKFIHQDYLDDVVWAEVVRLLEDPALIQQELDRRLAAARDSDHSQRREQELQNELTRVSNSIEGLLNAYQEQLLSLEQLRQRMPRLRQREQALRADLQGIADQINDRAAFLRLADTIASFLTKLRNRANTLDVMERQRIVRLVVKEVLVGEDTIVIRHIIPVASPSGAASGGQTQAGQAKNPVGQGSLLRPRGEFVA